MRKGLLRWGGFIAAVGLGVLLFFALRVPQGFSAFQEKNQQIRRLQKENADLAKENADKRDRVRKLRESRTEQELEIRKGRKLLRKGESSIITQDEENKEGASPP
jgi:cell division protein FtsB